MENTKKVISFDNLKDFEKIISPIDNEVCVFRIDKDGERYICDDVAAWAAWQFDPKDFYFYDGEKDVGEVDEEYLK